MRVTRREQVLQLAFMPRLFPVNCYLVEEEDSLTLVDAALPFGVKGILQTAAQLGKPLRNLVLTHAHDDHVGAVDGLKAQVPELTVWISERDARLLEGDRSLLADEPQLPIRGGVPKKVTTRPDRLLKEGDRIGSLQAIAAPGHTPGSMAFLDTRSGILLAGDAFQVRGGVAVSGTMRTWFPFPAWATWNKEAAAVSARKLIALNPTVLGVGHGVMLEKPVPLMEKALKEAEHGLKTVLL